VLGKHELAIYDNIKDAAMPSDQLSLDTEGVTQFIRQTGGIRLIVSLSAIMNIDFHATPPACTVHSQCGEFNLVLITGVVNTLRGEAQLLESSPLPASKANGREGIRRHASGQPSQHLLTIGIAHPENQGGGSAAR
jgi:hypothetical protein